MKPMELFVVLLGGGCGAAARYVVSVWAAGRWGTAFPYGTLVVNLAGCFAMGAFTSLILERWELTPYVRLLVTVGFLGGLTTFSSFGYETLHLMADGQVADAFFNVACNVCGGLLAVWLGLMTARIFS